MWELAGVLTFAAAVVVAWLTQRYGGHQRADFLTPWADPKCAQCEGSGTVGLSRRTCPSCRGRGRESP